MPEPATQPSTAELVAYEASLRALARRLVRDDADAEDLVQETWLEALRHPPRGVDRVQAWLGVVLRRKWSRTLRQRRARRWGEQRVREREEAGGDGADEVERRSVRVELERRVASLPARQARAIRLRYFEGLDVAEIAAREGVTESTVRTWLHRGLERLRARLDADHGGDRRRWVGALVAGLGLRPRGHGASLRALVAGAAGVALVAGAGWLLVGERGVRAAVVDVAPPPTVEPPRGAPPAPDVAGRRAVAGATSATALAAGPPSEAGPAPARSLRVRVLDRGAPVADAALWVSAPGRLDRGSVRARTDADGFAELLDLAPDRWVRPEWAGARWPQVHVASVPPGELLVVDARSYGVVEGRVSDPDGRPSAGTLVRVSGTEGHGQPWLDADGRLWIDAAVGEATTDAEGRFRLTKPTSSWMRVVAVAPDGACNVRTVPTRMDEAFTPLALRTRRPAAAAGRVLSRAGEPVAGARVALAAPPLFPDRATTTDAAGRFRLEGLPAGRQTLRLAGGAQTAERSLRLRVGRALDLGDVVLDGAAPAPPPAEASVPPLPPARGSGSLRVRLVDAEPRVPPALRDRGALLLHDRWRRRSLPLAAEDDELRFDALPAGTYTLLLECVPFAHEPRTVTLRADEHATVELPLRRGAPQLVRLDLPRPLRPGEELDLTLAGPHHTGPCLLPLERTATIRADHLLRRLAPGAYRLEARTSHGLTGALTFHVTGFDRAERVVPLR